MGSGIESIEGIGEVRARKLRAAGISTTADLLDAARRPAGRVRLSAATGIPAPRILQWANTADLFRISGVGAQFAELLEAAGVDSVKELRNRNAENLAMKLARIHDSRKLCGSAPSPLLIRRWIDQASRLASAIDY